MTMMPELEIEHLSTDDLVPYAGNAKEHPEWQVNQICNSIQQFGFDDPIAVWTNDAGELVIVEGHGRLLAAKELGISEVPCIRLDHLDDEARRAYTLVHNKLTTNTGYDEELLAAELAAIGDFDMGDFGFAEGETLESYDHVEEDTPPQPDYDEPAIVQPGQVWQLGRHRLMCGDSTKQEDVDKLFAGDLADMVLTDPPYNCDYSRCKTLLSSNINSTKQYRDIANDNMPDDKFEAFLTDIFAQIESHLKKGGSFYSWGNGDTIYRATKVLEQFESMYKSQDITWVKPSIVLGMKDYQAMTEVCVYGWKQGAGHYFAPTRSEANVIDETGLSSMGKGELLEYIFEHSEGGAVDVLRFPKPHASELHPTMKPVKLFAHLMRNSSRSGEIIYDAFGGSGTTVVAAEQMDRSAYVIELDPHYCDVIIKRWQDLTGLTAELLEC